jgi:hypothetical protein
VRVLTSRAFLINIHIAHTELARHRFISNPSGPSRGSSPSLSMSGQATFDPQLNYLREAYRALRLCKSGDLPDGPDLDYIAHATPSSYQSVTLSNRRIRVQPIGVLRIYFSQGLAENVKQLSKIDRSRWCRRLSYEGFYIWSRD